MTRIEELEIALRRVERHMWHEGYDDRGGAYLAEIEAVRAVLIVASRLPPETPNDREALRLQIERESALKAWRERGVL